MMSRQVTGVERIEAMRRRRPGFLDERITTAHGAGGKASRALVEGVIVPLLTDIEGSGRGGINPELERLGDPALLSVDGARIALTTDAFVVRPALDALTREVRDIRRTLDAYLDRDSRYSQPEALHR
jgi:hypothetical protein